MGSSIYPPTFKGGQPGLVGRGDGSGKLYRDDGTWVTGLGNYSGELDGGSVPATSTSAGDWYVINAAGTSQSITWAVGDIAIYEGTSGNWSQVAGTGWGVPQATQTNMDDGDANKYANPEVIHGYVNPQFAARAPDSGLHFTGGRGELPTTVHKLGDADGGIRIKLVLGSAPDDHSVLAGTGKRSSSYTANSWTLHRMNTGGVRWREYDGTGSLETVGIFSVLPEDEVLDLIIVRDKTNDEIRGYVNGTLNWTSEYTDIDLSSSNPVRLYQDSNGNSVNGVCLGFEIFNFAPTGDEVSALTRFGWGALPDRVHALGAGVSQTSGTLVIGKRYRITTFQAGDDFTNVGAGSNATGVEFTATGTTPTTYSNSSTLTTIGLCGSWDFSQGAGYQQRDLSGAGNRMNLTTTGVQRLKVGDFLQVKATLAHGGSGNLQVNGQALLPDLGWRLQSIVAESDASVDIYLGNVSGGSQLVTTVSLTADTPKDLDIVSGAAVPTTVNAWGNSDGAANITYTLTYVRTDIS